jgi:hypothetical protein
MGVRGEISEEREKLASHRYVLYQCKRALINAIEALDIEDDKELIRELSDMLPQKAWGVQDRKHWRK